MPWKPGESGNPNGRPKLGIAVAERLRGKDSETLNKVLAVLSERALSGEMKGIEMYLNYAIGKAMDVIEVHGGEEQVEASIEKVEKYLTLLKAKNVRDVGPGSSAED